MRPRCQRPELIFPTRRGRQALGDAGDRVAEIELLDKLHSATNDG